MLFLQLVGLRALPNWSGQTLDIHIGAKKASTDLILIKGLEHPTWLGEWEEPRQ